MAETERMAIVDADITGLDVDVIVNAANEQLAPGGGVCGAIHRVAGPKLAEDCAALVANLGPCPTGGARITAGHALQARHVIHAVGPVWAGGGAGEPEALAGAYGNALRLMVENSLKTIAFPAISTGIFGFPAPLAARIAVSAVDQFLTTAPSIRQVTFCCFGADSVAHHRTALAALS